MNTMDKVNIFNQMAQYDFGTPINVTMIFEEESDEESPCNALREQIQNVTNVSKKQRKENEIRCINAEEKTEINQNFEYTDKNTQKKANGIAMDCDDDSWVNKEKTLSANNSIIVVEADNNENTLSINDRNHEVPEKTARNILEMYQQISGNEELTAYVKDLLNTLSEHIILIMQSYYNHYYANRGQPINADAVMKLSQLKKHFFDLSYSSVVSLIIPQEKNEKFIEMFIDKTVSDANKVMKWKCERKHVEKVYKEMVEWTKQRREYIKKLQIPNKDSINSNKTLREHLTNPPRPFTNHTAAPLSAQNINTRSANTENGTCIFSYGAPGREISINVNPETLINHPAMQRQHKSQGKQSPTNKTKRKGNSDMYLPNSQQPLRLPMHYNSTVHHLPQNSYPQKTADHYPAHERQPPSYSSHIQYAPTMQQQYNQVRKNLSRTMQQYETQRNINTMRTSPQNNANFGDTYGPQNIGGRASEGPIITNVMTLNHTNAWSAQMNGRCCMCGKITYATCSKCNKFTYCSALCQELDSGIHKNLCGKL